MSDNPVLTIAIPTWNRAALLRQTLVEIQKQRANLPLGDVELLVCDNCSPDATPEVIAENNLPNLPIKVVRHSENIGSDLNIATCFNLARGRYVWILGDDDFPIGQTLSWLLDTLKSVDAYGLIFLRPYGYEDDFQAEYPGRGGCDQVFTDPADFLAKVGAQLTFISSVIVAKCLIPEVDAKKFCGSNLVQVEIYLSALIKAKLFYYSGQYRIACKRNNSGGYDFSEVFVERLGSILDRYVPLGLPRRAVIQLERAMLIKYFPQCVLKMQRTTSSAMVGAQQRFAQRFSGNFWYALLVAPIFNLPRPLAIIWGCAATFLGRSLSGDLQRGLAFAWIRLKRRISAQ